MFKEQMARFFFDTYDGHFVVRDIEGRELADTAAARREAMHEAKERIGDVIFRPDNAAFGEIRVRREKSRNLEFSLRFKDVIAGLRS